MDSFSHIVIGITVLGVAHLPQDPALFYIVIFMASLPDLDVLLSPLQKKLNSYYLSHRGASHSFIIGIIITAPFAGIFMWVTDYSFFFLWMFNLSFFSVHLFLDLLTMSQIPLFYPITKKEFRFGIERSVNFYLLLISGTFLLLYLILSLIFWSFFSLPWLIWIFCGFYGAYFGHRVLLRIWISHNLSKSQQFIPDLLPGAYGIYSVKEDEAFQYFTLDHHSLWIPSKLPRFHEIISKHTVEHEIYLQAVKNAKKFRFFRKWKAIIPILLKNSTHYTVILALGESLSAKYAYFYKGNYDVSTKNVSDEGDGFDLFHAINSAQEEQNL